MVIILIFILLYCTKKSPFWRFFVEQCIKKELQSELVWELLKSLLSMQIYLVKTNFLTLPPVGIRRSNSRISCSCRRCIFIISCLVGPLHLTLSFSRNWPIPIITAVICVTSLFYFSFIIACFQKQAIPKNRPSAKLMAIL